MGIGESKSEKEKSEIISATQYDPKEMLSAIQSPNGPKPLLVFIKGEELSEDYLKELGFALQSPNSAIKAINLSNKKLKNIDGLVAAFKSPNCKVNTLRLDGNQIENLDSLAAALHSPHCQIAHLHLSHNRISNLEPLAAALQSPHCRITHLHLSHNEISNLEPLAAALKSPECSKLIQLNLSHNKIKNVDSFVASLSCSPTLIDLDLSFNEIESIDSLCKGLQSQDCSLISLKLHGNPFVNQDNLKLLTTAVQNPRQLRRITFETSKNQFPTFPEYSDDDD